MPQPDYAAVLAELDARKAAIREEERQTLAKLREAEEAEDDRRNRAYWKEREAQNPDDPEVLRARAALIDRDRNAGITVAAKAATMTGEAH